MRVGGSFEELVRDATRTEDGPGRRPYAYQRRVAEAGLPDLLRVPTGAGKTLTAVLGWLYRRRFHADSAVRQATPHWLAFVLPMRVLVEQTERVVTEWLDNLGLSRNPRDNDSIGVHMVMGGEVRGGEWRTWPERDAIFIGTLDMLLSRALNRGYGESRAAWPIDFGLFNAGVHWVFDEVQLMGPALPTSRQLEGLRAKLGTAIPCGSTWMSATIDERALRTPDLDLPPPERVIDLQPADEAGPLRRRLDAEKTVRRLDLPGDAKRYPGELAEALRQTHRPGTLTLAVLNTVDRAHQVWEAIGRRRGDVELVLLHSRFRPRDRQRQVSKALLEDIDPAGPGRIVISTQVVEAGVDVSATTLFTEAAPWPSIVQRAGRCNRDGDARDALLLWAPPPKAKPYEDDDLRRSAEALADLEGRQVSAKTLSSIQVEPRPEIHPMLRRRDLLHLFDTAPDLNGNDLDVARFIRPPDGLDAQVAWWRVDATRGPEDGRTAPGPDELCPVPVAQVQEALADGKWRAWRFDHLAERWERCRKQDVRPGLLIVLDAAQGGYDPAVGWDPSSTVPVEPVEDAEGPSQLTDLVETDDGDRLSRLQRRWVPLVRHLAEAEEATRRLLDDLAPAGLGQGHLDAACVAARFHDVGKAHETFQRSIERTVKSPEEEHDPARDGGPPWAKSGGSGALRHDPRGFRHELVSALMLLDGGGGALGGLTDRDLAAFLVAAHHGRVRVAARSLLDERNQEARRVLGVRDGQRVGPVEVPGGRLPACQLDLSVLELGDGTGGRASWTDRVLRLRDDPALGPFRLAFLEAVVRLADWRVSADGRSR